MHAPVLAPETKDDRSTGPAAAEPVKVALRGMADAALVLEAGWIAIAAVTTAVNLDLTSRPGWPSSR